MGIFDIRVEHTDTRRGHDDDLWVPMPWISRELHHRVAFHRSGAMAFSCDQRRGKFNFRQIARHQQPAVIGHDSNACPARVEKLHHAIRDGLDLPPDLVNQARVELVPKRIDFADLRPATLGDIGGHSDLAALNYFHALAGHRLTKPLRRHRLFCGRKDRREVFGARGTFEHGVRGRCQRLAGCRNGRQRGDAMGNANLGTPGLQYLLQHSSYVEPETIGEQNAGSLLAVDRLGKRTEVGLISRHKLLEIQCSLIEPRCVESFHDFSDQIDINRRAYFEDRLQSRPVRLPSAGCVNLYHLGNGRSLYRLICVLCQVGQKSQRDRKRRPINA